MNNVNLIGRTVFKPSVKYVTDGTALCKFTIAVNGINKDDVNYFDCETWKKLAETIEKYVDKGHKIGIVGTLKQERWEDKEGNKKSRIKIIVNNIDFLESRKKDDTDNQNNQNDYNNDNIADDGLPY